MNRIDELIKKLCPNGVKFEKIENLTNFEQPTKYIVKSTKYNEEYDIPVLTAGQSFILGYTNEQNGIYNASKEKPVIIFDDFTGAFKWVDFPFKVKSSAIKIITAKNNKTTIRYLYHMMGFLKFYSNEHKRLWISAYSQFKVAVPPLEVQCEIVHILDDFTLLSAELSAELKARQKQYEYYSEKLLNENCEENYVRLGDITKTITKGTTPKRFADKGINFIKTEAFDGMNINKNKLSFVDKETHNGFLKRSILEENDILFTIAGATIGKMAIVKKELLPANTNQALAIIRLKDDINVHYIKFILKSSFMKKYIKKCIKGSAQPNLNLQHLNDFLVPFPNDEKQKEIMNILERFEKLCNDISEGLPAEIEARHKQYEYYRDKLLTFKELKVNE